MVLMANSVASQLDTGELGLYVKERTAELSAFMNELRDEEEDEAGCGRYDYGGETIDDRISVVSPGRYDDSTDTMTRPMTTVPTARMDPIAPPPL